ncbi:MAG TPA: sigma-54-dependent Fis family transcriptional regulator [Thioalkalivibrio sp.]|nr:sigma-54-dependent Fis family transcriptional regulator [Thioalkalivibrio sp.]
MTIQHILIVDDEPDIRELLEITLGRMGHDTRSAASVKAARALLDAEDFDLCLTDMRLPDGNGIELVSHIQATRPELPVAVITAFGSMDTAIEALKAGAFDFVSKPVDLKMLRDLVSAALRLSRGTDAPADTGECAPDQADSGETELLGDSKCMRQLKATIGKLARSQAPVYIRGESGSGKELVARQIHLHGPRARAPFVPVNCGAIPAELMESEFFGHLKGSFTGATADKAGLFQAADGGTLFLDEVAELPMHMQVKLLRAIQERAVKPVGAPREVPVDVRILSATHKDLAEEVREGRFRQDLYYRLNVIQVAVPPLRDRIDDLPQLARHLLARLAERWGTATPSLSDHARDALMTYPFPGNVRELENILERAATLCEGAAIGVDDLQLGETGLFDDAPGATDAPAPNPAAGDRTDLNQLLGHTEKEAIIEALEKTRWNRTQAAKLLGLTLRQLRYRLKKLGVE